MARLTTWVLDHYDSSEPLILAPDEVEEVRTKIAMIEILVHLFTQRSRYMMPRLLLHVLLISKEKLFSIPPSQMASCERCVLCDLCCLTLISLFKLATHAQTASNSKMRTLLPGYKFTSLEDGLQETVKWFCSYYEMARK